uniref:(northern house mosquito) hypothetical protein n=1 Tax=Culex pipiens TaxID=7175 RepID=A0A8D8I6K9_CULPI
MQRVCGVVGNDPLDEELNVEIVSKSKAAHTSCTCNLHKHIYITRYITETRAPVCDCDGAKFGAYSGVVFHEKSKKKNNNCKKTILGSGSRFRSSSRSPVGEIAPVFVWQRVAFPNAKSFPPVGLFWAEHSLANINSLKVHSVR